MGDQVQAYDHVFQSAAVADGNGTTMDVGGLPGVGVQIEGITTATVTWEANVDGTNWVAVRAMNYNSGAVATTATADGLFLVPVAGLFELRARISGYSAGTITISGKGLTNAANPMQLGDASGSLTVDQATHDNLNANVNLQVGDADVADDNPVPVGGSITPGTSGGWSLYRNIDLDETGVNAKTSVGQVGGWFFYNAASSVRYIKIYDKATAPASTDTPKMTVPVPEGSGANVEFIGGISFASGIGLRATTGVADNDVGAPAANDVVVNLLYK